MNVNIMISEQKTIDLPEEQVRDIVRRYLKNEFHLNRFETLTITDGKLENNYEAITSHRFDVTDTVRVATPDDILIVEILNKLKLNY